MSGAALWQVSVSEPESIEPTSADRAEHRALLLSMVAGVGIAVLGVVWGIVSGSQMVLFDGAYSLLGIVLSVMSLRAARLVAGGPTPRYPFGRESLAPLVIGLQGIALLATCAFASLTAVLTILDGGTEVTAGWAILYAVVSTVGPLLVVLALRADAARSELVAAESTQWAAGALLGVGMLVGFVGVVVLERTTRAWLAPYVDPTMVIVACVVLVPAPSRMVRTMLTELLEAAPDPAVQAQVHRHLDEVRTAHGLAAPRVRLSKTGRKLYAEIDFVVDPSWSVGEEDRVRHAIRDRLEPLAYDLWLSVEFSADEHWAD